MHAVILNGLDGRLAAGLMALDSRSCHPLGRWATVGLPPHFRAPFAEFGVSNCSEQSNSGRRRRVSLVEFRVLGEVELLTHGRSRDLGAPMARCVLAALLLSPGRPVSAATLEKCLWGEHRSERARSTLHAYISRLRGKLREASGGQASVELGASGYWLRIDKEQIDLSQFNRLRDQAREAAKSGDDEQAVELLREAESLWRGEALAGLPGEWAATRRAKLEEDHLAATLERIEIELRLGGHAALIGELAELASRGPVNEIVVGYLMIALHNAGRHEEALQAYQRVRKRLVAEIGEEPGGDLQAIHLRILRDDSSLAPVRPARRIGSPDPPDTLLSDVPDFTGREAEVRSLIAACGGEGSTETSIVIETINGMPGVGKTALVRHVAHRLRDRYQGGRFYLQLRAHDEAQAPLDPGSCLASLLRSFGVAGDRLPASLDERAFLWRSMIAGRRVLLVLDDAHSAEQILPLLPGSAGSVVLVTSRHRLTGFDSAAVILNALSPADSSALFTRIAGVGRCQDGEAVAAAVRLCGHLPLAIRLAASHLRDRPSWSIGDLVDELARARQGGYASGEITRGLTRSFELSYHGLDNSQQRLFRCLGMHPGGDFSLYAAAALNGAPAPDTDQLLDSLVDRNLLDEPKRRRYRFHDLLRDYACHVAQRDEARAARRLAVHRLLDYYLTVADQADRIINPGRRRIPVVITHKPPIVPMLTTASVAKQWLDAERENLLNATQLAFDQEWRTHATLFPHVLAPSFGLWGHGEQAARHHRAAAAMWRADGDSFGAAQALAELSAVLWRMGMYPDALTAARDALAIYQKISDQQGEADTLVLQGLVSLGSSRFHEAQPCFQRALLIRRAIGDLRGEAEALNCGAIARYHVGDYRDVLTDFGLALRLNRSIGDRHGEYMTLNNIGKVQKDLGRHDAALQNYRASFKIIQEVGTRQDLAVILNNLGELSEQPEDALRYFGSAVELYREVKDRRGEANSLVNLAYTLQHSGRVNESIAHFQQALEIAQQIGDRYEQTRSLIGLGVAQYDLGHYGTALDACMQGLKLAREMAEPREEAQALERIGTTILMLHGPSKARPWWEQALALYEQLGLPEAEELRARLRAD
jgi:DNA-binding SARP family transcriptional activator